jgi:hypothetical protein
VKESDAGDAPPNDAQEPELQEPLPEPQNPRAPGVSGEPEVAILITIQGNQLQVNGPLHDSIFMYGALERAKDVVRMHNSPRAAPADRTPSGLVIPRAGFRPPRR